MYYTILYLVNNNEICYTYDTYGKLTARTGNTDVIFKYNGRDGVITEENGLYYMRARYYCPEIKRFINADIVAGNISDAVTLNRFAYANGNPVSNIDPFGLSAERGQGPTPLEAAYMAQHAYDAKKSEYDKNLGDDFGGWTLEDIFDPAFKNIGLKICVYSRCVNGITAYSVVYVGTNMDFKKDETDENVFVNVIDAISDWCNNITQPIANSPDMKLGIIYAMYFSNKHKDSEITFVGHSKGGAEAAAAALSTNKDALLFNPATVNSYAYGLNTKKYTADMTAYIVKGEILNNIFGWMSTPIGDIEWLNSEETGAINKHSTRAIIEGLLRR